MPNGRTHEEYGKAAARLVLTCGIAPTLTKFFAAGRPDFIVGCSMPDRVDEVACLVPGEGPQTVMLGHNLSSFRHFQVDGRGYYWLGDESLSVAGALVAAAAAVVDARVCEYRNGLRPPRSGLTDETPLERALREQPGFTLGAFRFPSAGDECDYYYRAACGHLQASDLSAARVCAGFLAHEVADTCMPHHAWGVLLHGHAAAEDALEARWHETLSELIEKEMVESTLAPAIRAEMSDVERVGSVRELCADNALWARRVFGEPHDMPDCPGDAALRISVRAVATTIRALELAVAEASS